MTNHDSEPLAQTFRWTFHRPAAPSSCALVLREVLAALAATCQRASWHLIGHIKAYAPLPSGGFIRANTVSARRAPDVELHEPVATALERIDVTLNVLIVGMPLAACRQYVRDALDAAATRHGFEYSSVTRPTKENADG